MDLGGPPGPAPLGGARRAAYTRRTGRIPTAETYARIWNGGPDGWKKPTTAAYWRKVRAKLETKHKEAK